LKKQRHDLIEKIAENDDAVMSAYLDGKEISLEDLRKTLRKAVIANTIVPVFCGSALKEQRACNSCWMPSLNIFRRRGHAADHGARPKDRREIIRSSSPTKSTLRDSHSRSQPTRSSASLAFFRVLFRRLEARLVCL
jgi:hypothetical protein